MVFSQLRGRWRLRRVVPGQGWVQGEACFGLWVPGTLRYREEGRFEIVSGGSLRVSRDYYYILEPGRLRIAFDPPEASDRTLHTLRWARVGPDRWPLVASDHHLCGGDTYRGEYSFNNPTNLVIRTRVEGPAKRYQMTTVLERKQEPEEGALAS